MIRRIFALSLVLLLLIPATVSAQDSAKTEEEEKAREETEKKALALLDEVIKEASSLRLPENRIRLQAMAGDLLWKRDERRARILFKQAADGLIELFVQTGSPQIIYDAQTMRVNQSREQVKQEVLNIVAQHDAKLARDLIRSLRQPSQAQLAATEQQDIDDGQELRLASQIASSDPSQALQIAEESISRGLRMELIGILQQLNSKDRESAEKLLASVLKKLRSANLSNDSMSLSIAFSLLQMAIQPGQYENDSEPAPVAETTNSKPPLMDEKVIRELVEIVTTAALNQTNTSKNEDEDEEVGPYILMQLNSMIKGIEKYSPSRAQQISRKVAELNKKLPPEEKAYQEYGQLAATGSVETILGAVDKAPTDLRYSLYQQAAMKAFGEGDEARARQIINDNISDPIQREAMLNSIDQQSLWRKASEGKIEETRQMIARLPVEQRSGMLIRLAYTLISKGEKQLAIQVIDEARGMVSLPPANHVDLTSLLSVARVYGSIEPPKSFDIVEPIIDQFNTLLAAATVLDGFDYMRYFKDGELLPQNSGILVNLLMQCVSDMGYLAKGDFDKARLLADRFQRSELRLLARFYVAQGALSDRGPNQVIPILGRDSILR